MLAAKSTESVFECGVTSANAAVEKQVIADIIMSLVMLLIFIFHQPLKLNQQLSSHPWLK
ncbi:hypothetical protein D6Z04_08060 [Salmonella enterica subsp. enterica]|nr:hypothetical protein [Salmonella enterica]EAC1542080.1 hypothetical protein [Salmonella enterica subsp. enterica]EAT3647717.1 hypothetical protein [Salmonella enterica]